MPAIVITKRKRVRLSMRYSYNATAFVHALAFISCSSRCFQWNRFTGPNAKSPSQIPGASGLRAYLVHPRNSITSAGYRT